MAEILADEHVPPQIPYWLSRLGHDCHAVRQYCTDKRGDGWSDEEVLRFATERGWAVLTFNASHFLALAEELPWHEGIILGEPRPDRKAQARQMDDLVRQAIREKGTLRGQVIDARAT